VDKRVSKAFISQTFDASCFVAVCFELTAFLCVDSTSDRPPPRCACLDRSSVGGRKQTTPKREYDTSHDIFFRNSIDKEGKHIQSFHGKKFRSFYAVSVLYFYGALFALPRLPYEQPRRLLVFSDSLTIVSALF
jgi:hypothetical protein